MYLKFKNDESYIRGFNYGGVAWIENFRHPSWCFTKEECEKLRSKFYNGEQHLEIVE